MTKESILPVLSLTLALLASTGFCQSFLTNGLIAHYPFQGNANDESGNGFNAVVSNAIPSSDRFGIPSNAYSFNGTNAFISAGVSNLPSGVAPRTMTAWVMPTKAVMSDSLLSFLGYGAGYYQSHFCLGLYRNEALYFWGGYSDATFPEPSPLNKWSFVAVTYSEGSVTMWLDTGAFTVTLPLNTTDNGKLFVGVASLDGDGPGVPAGSFEAWFTGSIDEVRIYNRALTPEEIRELRDFEFPDADHDGLSDYEEINVYHTDPNKRDTDADGLSDYREVRMHNTDPLKPDSDGDGYNDYAEVYAGKNPNDINEHPAANLAAFTAIELEFISRTNTSYLIQASPDLTTWTNFEGPIAGDGNIWKKTYSTREAGRLYYRVELAP